MQIGAFFRYRWRVNSLFLWWLANFLTHLPNRSVPGSAQDRDQ